MARAFPTEALGTGIMASRLTGGDGADRLPAQVALDVSGTKRITASTRRVNPAGMIARAMCGAPAWIAPGGTPPSLAGQIAANVRSRLAATAPGPARRGAWRPPGRRDRRAAQEGAMIRLDIFSDPVCPWCMIGKANLDRALESRPGHPFAIVWHPFQLAPDMPREGTDRRAHLGAKFGGPERLAAAEARVEDMARASGLTVDLARATRSPNTLDAHRLIHWAGIEGRQGAVVDALFRAYFRDGRDIGDADTLADIAAENGMDRAAVARLLASEADRDDIAASDADARAKGVSAVPTFLIDRRYLVSGAQPVAMWQNVIDELLAQTGAAT